MGGSSKTTNTTQQTQSGPWAQAQPWLSNLVNQYSSLGTGVTGGQQNAVDALQSAAGSIPNFGSTASNAVSNLFNANTSPQVGMLNQGYSNLQNSLSGLANPANLNPMNTPGLGDALSSLNNSITNQVKGVYAGSGRDPAGAGSFAGSLARGLVQGEAPLITSQYNTNVGNLQNAANSLESAAGNTANAITQQNQVPLTDALQGINSAGMLSGLYTSPASTQLAAANQAYSLPYSNLGTTLTPAATLGALGSTSNSSGTSTTTGSQSLLGNILGGLTGGLGLLGGTGAFGNNGSSGWLSSGLGSLGSGLGSLFMLSDIRDKENIERIGTSFDGQPIHTFNYKGDTRPQIGMLAQEEEQHDPGAVVTIAGHKHINIPRATRNARAIAHGFENAGMLKAA